MRIKTELGKAFQVVKERSVNYWDEVYPASMVNFHDFDELEVEGTIYRLMNSAKRLFAMRLKVPHDYLERCPAHLQEANLNHWVQTLGQAKLFMRFDGQELRAVFTTRYKPINNLQVLARMLQGSFSEHDEVLFTLSNEVMLLNMPDHRRTFGLLGDRVTPGVSIVNSEVGFAAFSIQAFFLRLVCTNGLISAERAENKIRHVRANALESFEAILGQVNYLTEANQERLLLSASQPVDDPPSTIESFNRRFNVTKKEAEFVEAAWLSEPKATMWGVINAYTLAAQSRQITPETSYKFQQIGGLILNLVRN